jgi:hypothetical protein
MDARLPVLQSRMNRLLAFALIAYAVLDVLLTPLGRLEPRPVAQVTAIGFVTLALLFVGLVLALFSLNLLYRGSSRAATVAIVAAVLYFPAVLADQTGLFSSLRPPAPITGVELAQGVVAIVVIGLGAWMTRRGSAS